MALKRLLQIVLALALLAGGWLEWKKLFPGDEVLIGRRLEELARAASFGGQQSPLVRAAGAADLAACFTTNALIQVDSTGWGLSAVRGRAAIQQLALAARQQTGGLTVQFDEIKVAVKDRGTATVRLVATARGGGLTEPFHRELQLTLRKTDGKWLLEKVEAVAAVQRVD